MVTDLSVVCPGRLVTGKASCMIWKYEKKKKKMLSLFLTSVSCSVNKQLFFSCWDTAFKQTRMEHDE